VAFANAGGGVIVIDVSDKIRRKEELINMQRN
jgi:hypothetical protein